MLSVLKNSYIPMTFFATVKARKFLNENWDLKSQALEINILTEKFEIIEHEG